MDKHIRLTLKRYNIYSCLSLQIGNKEILFDPAKIRQSDIHTLKPDVIFLSHESMDHMDPTQIYLLQKKKHCKIFCSIAAAVDLIQYFHHDIDFIDQVIPMLPELRIIEGGLQIYAGKSDHCNYMYPLVYKIEDPIENISILHCFDSHLNDEIIELSKGTDLAIIPIGIAKGVSGQTGLKFALSLHSRYFITNHFKSEEELKAFDQLIASQPLKERFFLVDWNHQCRIQLQARDKIKRVQERSIDQVIGLLKDKRALSEQQLKEYFIAIYKQRSKALHRSLFQQVLGLYENCTEANKVHVLMIATFVSLLDSSLIPKSFASQLKADLSALATPEKSALKASVFFFLGVYSQQVAHTFFLDEVATQLQPSSDHVQYWMVEFLGRSATSKGEGEKKARELLLQVIDIPALYTSLVVRRKIFWELYRIMTHTPELAARFFPIFEDGLVDENPDVRLLAILCFGLANRVHELTSRHIKNIFSLFDDIEDDVRETAAKIAGKLYRNHRKEIEKKVRHIQQLLSDKNCHVRFVAKETIEMINPRNFLQKSSNFA
ncbi:MAG: sister chromatid cohesion protein PDS5 [Chlamydiota bacterium]